MVWVVDILSVHSRAGSVSCLGWLVGGGVGERNKKDLNLLDRVDCTVVMMK